MNEIITLWKRNHFFQKLTLCMGGLSMPGNWIFSAYTIRSYVQPTAPCAGNHFEPSRFFKIQGHKGTFNMNELYRGVGTFGDRGITLPQFLTEFQHFNFEVSRYQNICLQFLLFKFNFRLSPHKILRPSGAPTNIGSKTNKSTQIWKLVAIFWSIEQRKKNLTLTSTEIAIQIQL